MSLPSTERQGDLAPLDESPKLFGRERELAVIDDLFEHIATRGQSLLILGEAGIGKSALLDEAKKRAEELGVPVLSTSGAPFETPMPFAGLQRLLRPLLHEIGSLPDRQREALSVAFGISDGPSPDIFLIALAALDLLADRATDAPLLLIVEDAHWLDVATCDVLAFIARRVETEAITLLLAARDDQASNVGELDLPKLRLEALDDASAKSLIGAHAPDLPSHIHQRLLDEAEGNPLALLEFPRALGSEKYVVLPPTAPLPITERLERAFADRVSDVPTATRKLLLIAALDEAAVIREILAAASLVGDVPTTLDDIAPAEAAGLVSVSGHGLRFRHPLVRAAIYHGAPTSAKQAAHQALAETHAADPDRSVWHRAAALTGPDEQVAVELEGAAERALHRGAPAAAAAALERAARLTESEINRGHLLVRAAEIDFELGNYELALRHLGEAKELTLGDQDRTRLTFMLEASDEDSWSGGARVTTFAETANKMIGTEGPALALKSLLTVAVGCWWGNPTQQTRDLVVATAERLRVGDDDPALLAVLACADPVKRGALVIDRISRMTPDATEDPVALHLVGTAATAVWAFDLSWDFLSRAVEGLRAQGRLGLLAQALVSQSWAAVHLAKETIAMSAADEAARLARETGQLRWALAADLAKATVAGERGDLETANGLANQAEAELLPLGAQPMLSLVQFARGRYAVAHQMYSEGFDHLMRIIDTSDVAYHPFVGYWALADLIETAVHAGETDKAGLYLDELEAVAAETSASYLRATVAYARTTLTPEDEAEARYQTALDGDLSRWPCYRGRLLLNYGRWLRRQRRVAESRAPLRAARESFDALAFDGLAEIARQELRASGEASVRRTPDARDHLSPQELQIAQMAAAGLSNREIGQKLFLSHRTVGSHLYRIFPKLGVRSRSQLGEALQGLGS